MPDIGDFRSVPVDDSKGTRKPFKRKKGKKGGVFDKISDLLGGKKSQALINYKNQFKKFENRLVKLEGRIRRIEGQYKENKISEKAVLNLVGIKANVLLQRDDLEKFDQNIINAKALIDIDDHINEIAKHLEIVVSISKDVELIKAPELPTPLPPPPIDGIKIGLPNIGNTCFANSFLKQIAFTTDFDDLLNLVPDDDFKELHSILRDIVHTLRSAKHFKGCIINKKDYTKFMKKFEFLIQMADPDYEIGEQADAVEVLQMMMTLFGFQPSEKFLPEQYEHIPLTISEVIDKSGKEIDDSLRTELIPYAEQLRGVKSSEFVLAVSCDSKDKTININDSLLQKDIFKGRNFDVPKNIQDKLPNQETPQVNYLEINIIKKLPQTLLIALKRLYTDDGGRSIEKFNSSPLITDKDGFIVIDEFPDFDPESAAAIEDLRGLAQPVKYRIKSVILHHKPDIDHYTAVEWTGTDYIHHNDRAVTSGIDFNFIKEHGVFYMLERVD